MRVKFTLDYLQALAEGREVKGKPKYNKDVIKRFLIVVQMMKNAENSAQLRAFKGLNFEKLKNSDRYSVRINLKYRLEFRIENDELSEIILVEDLSNHYGDN
ncbi:type II toxin-antitoxin system RelE/ParE family toxin [Siphonobacter sp. SORGH_AS_1065]|uniref:type II toxin-antitoxin system RelE/ParE family toxin n=1 Tax=Siphonobacter sp. SORGH_AS_1065 TaxID=3041795 RepID=UPI002787487A|nr:type II toxin-antitoxin system RelE/ParE family toxin [Siphonobacter sp. SORGH_AS_1065]MDQ1086776.1 plasmid maintenance system killer protein [Siphonobacter sp. SORGH_AS_1065]